ncbi:CPBP family intramembrane glutamic endopeptidase [Crateriforma conspicua]|uniref:CAAX amino terminal protease self-immunity n=1 Tax=Crateriforma conspicua TaxID=2527996 RepID=A0A5C6FS69_9PLAN|nr:type II CAAX endopeptidase family protein [Crateriforma conspicua]TWU65074.1 CAAX amino terminal protease self- immunity [Crateriforma conspicua]
MNQDPDPTFVYRSDDHDANNPYADPGLLDRSQDPPALGGDAESMSGEMSAKGRPRVWTVFVALMLGLVLAVGFQVLWGIVMGVIEAGRGTPPQQIGPKLMSLLSDPWVFLLILVMSQAGFALAAWIGISRSPIPWRHRIAWRRPRAGWHVYPVTMLSSLLPLAFGLWAAIQVAKVIPADTSLEGLFDNFTVSSGIAFVVLIGLLPGVIEEVLFRGYVQTRLVHRWGAVIGIAVTSILFALVHGGPHAIAAAAWLGCWFGYLAFRSDSIWPTIGCHIFVNSGLNAYRLLVMWLGWTEGTQTVIAWGATIVGSIFFAVCLWPGYWQSAREQEADDADAAEMPTTVLGGQ